MRERHDDGGCGGGGCACLACCSAQVSVGYECEQCCHTNPVSCGQGLASNIGTWHLACKRNTCHSTMFCILQVKISTTVHILAVALLLLPAPAAAAAGVPVLTCPCPWLLLPPCLSPGEPAPPGSVLLRPAPPPGRVPVTPPGCGQTAPSPAWSAPQDRQHLPAHSTRYSARRSSEGTRQSVITHSELTPLAVCGAAGRAVEGKQAV